MGAAEGRSYFGVAAAVAAGVAAAVAADVADVAGVAVAVAVAVAAVFAVAAAAVVVGVAVAVPGAVVAADLVGAPVGNISCKSTSNEQFFVFFCISSKTNYFLIFQSPGVA